MTVMDSLGGLWRPSLDFSVDDFVVPVAGIRYSAYLDVMPGMALVGVATVQVLADPWVGYMGSVKVLREGGDPNWADDMWFRSQWPDGSGTFVVPMYGRTAIGLEGNAGNTPPFMPMDQWLVSRGTLTGRFRIVVWAYDDGPTSAKFAMRWVDPVTGT